MFVSKKYKFSNVRSGGLTIYECIAELDTGEYVLVFKRYGGKEFGSIVVDKITAKHDYIEYIEPPKPVVHTRYVHWLKDFNGVIYTMTEKEKQIRLNGSIVFRIDEVTFTELTQVS